MKSTAVLYIVALMAAAVVASSIKTGEIKVYNEPAAKTILKSQTGAEPPANTIDSPPIGGFVPLVALTTTDAGIEDEMTASPASSPYGNYTASNPSENYAIGLFDTGASVSIISYENSVRLNLFDTSSPMYPDTNYSYLTPNVMQITGVNDTVDLGVTAPIGLFVQGLGAIDDQSEGSPADMESMMGLYNVSFGVGLGYTEFDNPTAIGCPIAACYTTVIDNQNKITVQRDGQTYSSPDVTIYQGWESQIPDYNTNVPLRYNPAGSTDVAYFYDMEYLMNELMYRPQVGSTLSLSYVPQQSLFFLEYVNLENNGNEATEKTEFMFDTGAQVTVIKSALAALLGLDGNNPDFEVEIKDATGGSEMAPGFYIDRLEIPIFGEWFIATNVPVVIYDIASPAGGNLDGIIGTNLFTQFNLKIYGGLLDYSNPSLEIERFYRTGDVAPYYLDGVIDNKDLAAFAAAWNTTPADAGWNSRCDINEDTVVDISDLILVSDNWLEGYLPQD
jgi:hypothetical protein